MVFSEVPMDSGLPKLPIPRRAPRSTARRFILSAVLHSIQSRKSGFISQREIVEMLNRGARSSVQEHLHAMRTGHYLSRTITRKSLTDADEYRPGTALKNEHLTEWKELTRKLFGRAGICRGLFTRPAFWDSIHWPHRHVRHRHSPTLKTASKGF